MAGINLISDTTAKEIANQLGIIANYKDSGAITDETLAEILDVCIVNPDLLKIAELGYKATEIAQSFFYESDIVTADFPLVTKIGEQAFRMCRNLTTANFPKAENACGFYECSSLKSINFPAAISKHRVPFTVVII